jgi:transposase
VTCIQKDEETRNVNDYRSHPQTHTIKRISDELWDKIKIKIKIKIKKVLPKEKSPKTVGGRPIVPYRKVLDGILYVLRTRCQWKMLPKEHGSGSTIHRRFQEWNSMNVFKNIWIKLLEMYDVMMVLTVHGSSQLILYL